jgi:hypothetical protein
MTRTWDDLAPNEQKDLQADFAMRLALREFAQAEPGPIRPSIALLFAYAETPRIPEAAAIARAIAAGGRTARDWQTVKAMVGASQIAYAAAADDGDAALAWTLNDNIRIELRESSAEPDLFVLVINLAKSPRAGLTRLEGSTETPRELVDLELDPAIGGIIQMDLAGSSPMVSMLRRHGVRIEVW